MSAEPCWNFGQPKHPFELCIDRLRAEVESLKAENGRLTAELAELRDTEDETRG